MTRRPTWAELQDAISRAAQDARYLDIYTNDPAQTGNVGIAQRAVERSAAEANRLMRLATMTDDELREVPEE